MKSLALPLAIVIAFGLLPAAPSRADTLLIQRTVVAQKQDLPRRGTSMAQVEARYGAPREKFAPVGGGSPRTPPITRWQYDNFAVYFENSHVVDAVLMKAGPMEIGPAPVTP